MILCYLYHSRVPAHATHAKTIIVVEDEQDQEAGAALYLARPGGHLMKVSLEKVPGS